jgi:hypothetical protein
MYYIFDLGSSLSEGKCETEESGRAGFILNPQSKKQAVPK